MATKNYSFNGISTSVEFGKNGLLIKAVAGGFQVRNNGDSAFVKMEVADGAAGNEAVNYAQMTTSIQSAIDNLVDAAPGTLDTLNELAAALGDDPNFATTITNQIAAKQNTLTAGTGINITGDTISVDATAAEISADDTGFTVLSGATSQALFADADSNFASIATNNGYIDTLFGVSTTDQDLGTFTGTTIPDDSSVKSALQSLETELESLPAMMMGCKKVAFDYTDSTVNIGTSIPSGALVEQVRIFVTTPFDNINGVVEVGTSGDADALAASSDSDLQENGVYTKDTGNVLGSDTQYIATVTPSGSTQGAGYVVINYCN